jgi:hypothetical protein
MTLLANSMPEVDVSQLNECSLQELRALWKQSLGVVPKHQSAELLRLRLAYELQVRRYGGLKPGIRRQLQSLHKAFSRDADFCPLPTRDLAMGTILTKQWKGKMHKVAISDDGFEYEQNHYQSLSQIAELISGSKRSGPAFFGFREAPR